MSTPLTMIMIVLAILAIEVAVNVLIGRLCSDQSTHGFVLSRCRSDRRPLD
jgi:hypothetical protein